MGLVLLYYLIIPVFLAFCFVFGYLFTRIVYGKTEFKITSFSLFLILVTGIVMVVSVYSIIITGGRTVSWMYILILAAYIFFQKQNSSKDTSPVISRKELIISGLNFLLVSLLLFIVYLSSLLNFKTHVFTDTNCDWQFYSKISQYLNLGYESTTQFDNIVFSRSFTPYHYFEIWISAIISKLFSIPSQIALSIVMPTVLGIVAYFGILSFSAQLNLRNRILSLLLLFFSSVTFFSSFLGKLGVTGLFTAGNISSVVYMFKLYSFMIFFILALHHAYLKNFFLVIICLLFIPIASVVAAPTIIPIVWILSLIYYLKNGKELLFLKFIVFLSAYTILFVCFYLFFWDRSSLESFFSYQGISTHVYSLINPLLLILNVLPFIIFIFYFKKDILVSGNIIQIIFKTYLSLLLISLIITVLTADNFNGIQFFTNIFVPLSATVFAFFILRLNIRKSFLNKLLYAIIAVLLLSSMYYSTKRIYRERYEKQDPIFIAKIYEYLKPTESQIIYCAFIHSQTFYSYFYANSYSKLFMVGESIDVYRNNILQVGLSDFTAYNFFQNEYRGTKRTKEFALVAVPQGTFYKFVESEKENGKFISIENSQIKFIRQYNINHIFIQKDASISDELFGKLKLLASEEGVSGYSFYEISE